MSATAPFIPDTIAVHNGATVSELTAAQLTTKFGSGNVKTASKNFAFAYKGHTIYFRAGVPQVVDAGLAAALVAAGAPVS